MTKKSQYLDFKCSHFLFFLFNSYACRQPIMLMIVDVDDVDPSPKESQMYYTILTIFYKCVTTYDSTTICGNLKSTKNPK